MDDNIGLNSKNDPLLNNSNKKKGKNNYGVDSKTGGGGTLAFLARAEEETK